MKSKGAKMHWLKVGSGIYNLAHFAEIRLRRIDGIWWVVLISPNLDENGRQQYEEVEGGYEERQEALEALSGLIDDLKAGGLNIHEV
jgi:hypothetical protein